MRSITRSITNRINISTTSSVNMKGLLDIAASCSSTPTSHTASLPDAQRNLVASADDPAAIGELSPEQSVGHDHALADLRNELPTELHVATPDAELHTGTDVTDRDLRQALTVDLEPRTP